MREWGNSLSLKWSGTREVGATSPREHAPTHSTCDKQPRCQDPKGGRILHPMCIRYLLNQLQTQRFNQGMKSPLT